MFLKTVFSCLKEEKKVVKTTVYSSTFLSSIVAPSSSTIRGFNFFFTSPYMCRHGGS
jgi:hypothetical protein